MQITYGAPVGAHVQGHAIVMGDFDGVHRGHRAMLAVLKSEALRRGILSCVLLLEPRERALHGGTARVSTLRDKLAQLQACGVDRCVVLPGDHAAAGASPYEFIDRVLVGGLAARYVLVDSEVRFGQDSAGDHSMLAAAGTWKGFEVACMKGYELNGARVSSAAVRQALAHGDLDTARSLIGHGYAISGHVVHGRKLGRVLGFPTLNQRVGKGMLAARGIFVARVSGLGPIPLPGVANLGVRPSLDPNDVNGGRVLLETHCLQWPADIGPEGAYGRIVHVQLLHKLHDELKYPSLDALQQGIAQDRARALEFFRGELRAERPAAAARLPELAGARHLAPTRAVVEFGEAY